VGKRVCLGFSLVWHDVVWSIWTSRNYFIFFRRALYCESMMERVAFSSLKWFFGIKKKPRVPLHLLRVGSRNRIMLESLVLWGWWRWISMALVGLLPSFVACDMGLLCLRFVVGLISCKMFVLLVRVMHVRWYRRGKFFGALYKPGWYKCGRIYISFLNLSGVDNFYVEPFHTEHCYEFSSVSISGGGIGPKTYQLLDWIPNF